MGAPKTAPLREQVISEITAAPGWNKADATALVDALIAATLPQPDTASPDVRGDLLERIKVRLSREADGNVYLDIAFVGSVLDEEFAATSQPDTASRMTYAEWSAAESARWEAQMKAQPDTASRQNVSVNPSLAPRPDTASLRDLIEAADTGGEVIHLAVTPTLCAALRSTPAPLPKWTPDEIVGMFATNEADEKMLREFAAGVTLAPTPPDALPSGIEWEDVVEGLECALSYPAEMEVNRERWRAARIAILAATLAPTPPDALDVSVLRAALELIAADVVPSWDVDAIGITARNIARLALRPTPTSEPGRLWREAADATAAAPDTDDGWQERGNPGDDNAPTPPDALREAAQRVLDAEYVRDAGIPMNQEELRYAWAEYQEAIDALRAALATEETDRE